MDAIGTEKYRFGSDGRRGCTLFQPRRPETRAKPDALHRAEAGLPVDALVAECLEGLEWIDYGPEYYPADWSA